VIPSIIAYLRVDAGVRFSTDVDMAQYKNNQAQKGRTGVVVQSGGNDWGTSMIGVKGTADLDPDLSVFYRVESGFNATNGDLNGNGAGSNNSLFNRRAYAGLSNPQYGSISFGKDMSLTDHIWDFDPMLKENMSTATLVNGRNWNSVNDMVQYSSPKWGGLQINGQASFGNGDGGQTTTKVATSYAAELRYTVGRLDLQAMFDEVQDTNGRLSSLYSASDEGTLGATLDLKPVKLFLGYERLSAPDASRSKAGAGNPGSTVYASYNTNLPSGGTGVYATGANMGWVGAGIQVTPAVILRGAWFYTDVNSHGGHASLATAGIEYYLTKNAFLYLTVGEVMNSGKADFAADIGSPPPQVGKSQFAGFDGISIQF
jgi:predicted porin